MKSSIIFIFFTQILFSFGFFHELNFPLQYDEDISGGRGGVVNGNDYLVENYIEQERDGCGQSMEGDDMGQMKLVVRLKRIAECNGRT